MNIDIDIDIGTGLSFAGDVANGGAPDESDEPDEWGLRPSARAYETAERERLRCMPARQLRERRTRMLDRLPFEFAADVTALFEDVRRMFARGVSFWPFVAARGQVSRAKRRRTRRPSRAGSTAADADPAPSETAPPDASDTTAEDAMAPRAAEDAGPDTLDIARAEARLICELACRVPAGTPLRLLVAGDLRTDTALWMVVSASLEWPGRACFICYVRRASPRQARARAPSEKQFRGSFDRHRPTACAAHGLGQSRVRSELILFRRKGAP